VYLDAHLSKGIMDFLSFLPSLVREYLTLGGEELTTTLFIRPMLSICLKTSESAFGLIPSIAFNTSLKPIPLPLPMMFKVNRNHFLETSFIVWTRGHDCLAALLTLTMLLIINFVVYIL